MLLLDGEQNVVFLSSEAEDLLSRTGAMTLEEGRLRLVQRQHQVALDTLIQGCFDSKSSGMINLSGSDPVASRLLVSTVQPRNHELFPSHGLVAVFVVAGECEETSKEDVIGQWLGLTGAEARVAGLIAQGRRPAEIAEEIELSVHTVRPSYQEHLSQDGSTLPVPIDRAGAELAPHESCNRGSRVLLWNVMRGMPGSPRHLRCHGAEWLSTKKRFAIMFAGKGLSALLDALYYAPYEKSGWQEFLNRMVSLSDSRSARILVMNKDADQVFSGVQVNTDAKAHKAFVDHFVNLCPWRPGLATLPPGQFYSSFLDGICDQKTFYRSEFFNDWARELDIHHGASGTIWQHEGQTIQVFMQRTGGQGHFTRAEDQCLQCPGAPYSPCATAGSHHASTETAAELSGTARPFQCLVAA